MIIRRVETSDVARVTELCSEGWRQTVQHVMSESYQHQTISHWYNPEKVCQDIAKGSYSYVAEADQQVVGVIGGGMTSHSTAEIFVFYIDEAYRYQGIGRQLLERLTRDHKRKGAAGQWVSVQEGNDLGRPFYESRGFKFQSVKETKAGTGEIQKSLRFMREI